MENFVRFEVFSEKYLYYDKESQVSFTRLFKLKISKLSYADIYLIFYYKIRHCFQNFLNNYFNETLQKQNPTPNEDPVIKYKLNNLFIVLLPILN